MMNVPNKSELQQIALNHSSDINFKHLMKLYKHISKKSYSFSANKATLPSDNP